MDYQFVKVEIADNIGIVAMNRVDALNALNVEIAKDITESVRALGSREDVRVIILKSNARIFCAGLDLKAFTVAKTSNPIRSTLNFPIDDPYLLDCCMVLEECRKPLIGAINGKCIGGGLDIACACDIRLCTEDAEFSLREAGIGLVADMGVLQRLPLIVGQGFAREMAFTARYYKAREVEKMGLVNGVYPDQTAMMEATMKLAAEIAANAPLAVEGSKETLNYSRNKSIWDGMLLAMHMNMILMGSDDMKESAKAFMEKRKPQFKGR